MCFWKIYFIHSVARIRQEVQTRQVHMHSDSRGIEHEARSTPSSKPKAAPLTHPSLTTLPLSLARLCVSPNDTLPSHPPPRSSPALRHTPQLPLVVYPCTHPRCRTPLPPIAHTCTSRGNCFFASPKQLKRARRPMTWAPHPKRSGHLPRA
ncbi:hypothetical protein EJ04DRAFT_364986 [Polyplosphaeria fusca]|uniref:Uncharacterized protein n=1 Tax=Polyplosphaeria fusca TaxID=682080 RepID=A0A9P4QSE1_9PLEO|nr:hypothetical protein EJ04DRAFT_364986 [Polyplosphaeria fusca]